MKQSDYGRAISVTQVGVTVRLRDTRQAGRRERRAGKGEVRGKTP